MPLTEDDVREALCYVEDPELHVNIVDLGLIYGIEVDSQNNVNVRMTLTSPACPLGPAIKNQVMDAIRQLPLSNEIYVQLVWSPAWDPHTMASEDARLELGIY